VIGKFKKSPLISISNLLLGVFENEKKKTGVKVVEDLSNISVRVVKVIEF